LLRGQVLRVRVSRARGPARSGADARPAARPVGPATRPVGPRDL